MRRFHYFSLFIVAIGLQTAACNPTMYWVQTGKTNQQTAADLHACRLSVQPVGGNQVFTAADLERSCMGAKGYSLSRTPNP